MATDLSSKTVLVADTGGQNIETALRLAKDFGKVYYCTKFDRGFNRLAEAAPGMGLPNIEWVYDLWSRSPDLYVFPDCSDMSIQIALVESGKLVWGSRMASWLEHKRKYFLETLAKVGLQTPKWEEVMGLTGLREYLSDHPDTYVKCSYWRGSCETHHHISMELSAAWLHSLEAELGGLRELVPFIVMEPIDAVVEQGYDGYCVDGNYPKTCLQGIEVKDESYIGSVTDYAELPEPMRKVNEAFAPILKDYQYRNRWSTEIRVTKDNGFYFTDPTCRIPSPAGEAQLANEKNTGEIYWHGAQGELVEPEYIFPFAVQLVIHHTEEPCLWRPVLVPPDLKHNVYLKYACYADGLYWITPQTHDDIIGWIVGLGDTIAKAIDQVMAVADMLDGQCLKINTASLSDSLKAVQEQEKQGMEFTSQPVPKLESVLTNEVE